MKLEVIYQSYLLAMPWLKNAVLGSYSLMSKMRYGSLHSSITKEREGLRRRDSGRASEKAEIVER